jgi:hypothetical protein
LSRLLVGVGSVSQWQSLVSDTGSSLVLLGSVEGGVLLPEVVTDGLVVGRSLLKSLESESSPGRLRNGPFGLDLGDDGVVVGRRADDGGSAVVLGSGTEKGDSSDVNLLDGSSKGTVGLLGLQDERVKVADDKGDGGNVVVGEVLEVGGNVSGQDT